MPRGLCSPSGPIGCAPRRAEGFPRRWRRFETEWPCTADLGHLSPPAGHPCSEFAMRPTRPTTAPVVRRAGDCWRTVRCRRYYDTTGHGRSMRSSNALMTRIIRCFCAGVAANAAIAVAVIPPAAVAQRAPADVPSIPLERFTLRNGLTVLLSPDHSSPIVSVTVWYHVGSKNERVRRTGFAHLFEHLMFQGSQHVERGEHIRIIENAGGDMNGTTSNDRTKYYETVPINQLETVLWLESDRIGYLLPALSQAKLDNQRDVVKNERRQRIDNQPFGSADEVLDAALFPASNPYSWPVIGSMADLSAASLEDVKEFFRRYYAPDNA